MGDEKADCVGVQFAHRSPSRLAGTAGRVLATHLLLPQQVPRMLDKRGRKETGPRKFLCGFRPQCVICAWSKSALTLALRPRARQQQQSSESTALPTLPVVETVAFASKLVENRAISIRLTGQALPPGIITGQTSNTAHIRIRVGVALNERGSS